MALSTLYQTQTKPTARLVLRVPRVPTRRRMIQPQSFQPTLHTRYAHPDTGDKVFGIVPPIDGVPISASAPIGLTHGWQSKSGGMGVSHIWHGHAEDVIQHGGTEISDVPRFVADIIQPETPILRLENEGHQARLGVYRAGIGLVVLGPKRCGYHWRWLVITAYKPDTFMPRNQVGRIELSQSIPVRPASAPSCIA